MPEAERARMMAVRSIGPKMVGYLEMIGIESLGDLVGADPLQLALRINVELGRNHINRQGTAALSALVDAAGRACKQA